MSENSSNEKIDRAIDNAATLVGGKVLGKACARAADSVFPGSGAFAEVAASLAPDRAKKGAALGAFVGAGVAGKIYLVGTAGAIAVGSSILVPAALVGSAIFGVAAFLLGDSD
jgi:hypothetical protein